MLKTILKLFGIFIAVEILLMAAGVIWELLDPTACSSGMRAVIYGCMGGSRILLAAYIALVWVPPVFLIIAFAYLTSKYRKVSNNVQSPEDKSDSLFLEVLYWISGVAIPGLTLTYRYLRPMHKWDITITDLIPLVIFLVLSYLFWSRVKVSKVRSIGFGIATIMIIAFYYFGYVVYL